MPAARCAAPATPPCGPGWVGGAGRAWEHWARQVAAMPFDALRAQYASAVRAGAVQPSLLDAGRFERGVARWECLVLGPWARMR